MENNETTELGNSNPEISTQEATPTGEMYNVKIDGEMQQVSMDELQNGYQRQADYTRKTQELATERERLAQGEAIVQALESDWITKIIFLLNQKRNWTPMKLACDELNPILKNKTKR